MKFRFLTIFCLFIGMSFLGCTDAVEENNIPIATLHELLQKEKIIVLDVRTPEEIAQGKITSSALEANFYDDHFIEIATAKISKEEPVYVYCKGGNRSAKAVGKLQELGYSKVYNVEGGINAWQANGYKIEN